MQDRMAHNCVCHTFVSSLTDSAYLNSNIFHLCYKQTFFTFFSLFSLFFWRGGYFLLSNPTYEKLSSETQNGWPSDNVFKRPFTLLTYENLLAVTDLSTLTSPLELSVRYHGVGLQYLLNTSTNGEDDRRRLSCKILRHHLKVYTSPIPWISPEIPAKKEDRDILVTLRKDNPV